MSVPGGTSPSASSTTPSSATSSQSSSVTVANSRSSNSCPSARWTGTGSLNSRPRCCSTNADRVATSASTAAWSPPAAEPAVVPGDAASAVVPGRVDVAGTSVVDTTEASVVAVPLEQAPATMATAATRPPISLRRRDA